MVIRFLRSIAKGVGIDGSIIFTVLARSLQAGGGLVMILIISQHLSKIEQGYYYTFGSILAIQIFFELGLNGIISQYVAHEAAHVVLGPDHTISGSLENASRLSSLLRFCIKWFGALSLVLFVSLLISGYYFFTSYNRDSHVDWQRPWFLLALGSSLMLFIDPLLGFLEGLGKVKEVARLRLVQQTVMQGVMITLLICGGKLYSNGVALICAFFVLSVCLLFSTFGKILWNILNAKGEWVVNYAKEILPYQWRIALSWISGYFIFQLFNPILFATEGPIVAGRMGMTLAAFNGISSLSMSWISTKIPVFSRLIAKKNYVDLDQLFGKTFKQAQAVNAAGVIVFILILVFLRSRGFLIADRFLPLIAVLLLAIAAFTNQMIFSWATYLRCHKEEPFLLQSIVVGALCALSTICLGKIWGLMGIVGGYSFIVVFVSMVWGYTIFKAKRVQWHY